MAQKPLCEHLAKIQHDSLMQAYRYRGEETPEVWEDLVPEAKAARLLAMAEVLDSLDLLGLHIRLEADRVVVRAKYQETPSAPVSPPAPPHKPGPRRAPPPSMAPSAYELARSRGYEGVECDECKSLNTSRNGSCLKCHNCGSTSGCS